MQDPNKPDDSSPPNPEDELLRVEPEKLDQSYARAVVDHINKKAVSPNDACQVCGSHVTIVSDMPFKILVKEKEGAVDSGREMPLLATVCNNCGHARFFNRIIVDHLIEADRQAEAKKLEKEVSEQGNANGG